MMTQAVVWSTCDAMHASGAVVSYRQVYAQVGGNSANVRDWVKAWKGQHAPTVLPLTGTVLDTLELLTDVAALDARYQWLQQNLPALEERRGDLRQAVDDAERQLAGLQGCLTEDERLHADLQGAIAELRGDLRQLAEGKEARLERLTSQIAQAEQSLRQLEAQPVGR